MLFIRNEGLRGIAHGLAFASGNADGTGVSLTHELVEIITSEEDDADEIPENQSKYEIDLLVKRRLF